jgi:NADH:ubiquinone oxidoreductase subunit C
MDADLSAHLKAIPGVVSVTLSNAALWVEAPELDVEAMAGAMAALGIRLGAITAIPQSLRGETTIVYHYAADAQIINIRTRTRNGALASVAGKARPASWAEREIKDLFGVEFPGHPNLVPLLKPAGFENGMMRKAMCGPAVLAKSPTSLATP